MPRKLLVRSVLVGYVVQVLLLGISGAVAAAPSAIEPRAAEILEAALNHVAATASFRIRADLVTETLLPSGQKLHDPESLEIAVRRPDRLWYRLEGERRRVAAWYDGRSFTLLDSAQNVYASTPAPAGLGPLFEDMSQRLGFRPPLLVLLREDSPGVVAQRMVAGFYVGRGEAGGTASHHLAFRQESIDLEFWIAAEGAPLIKRIVITQKKRPAQPQLSYTIVSWEPDPVLADTLFDFTPPRDAVRGAFESMVNPGREQGR